MRKVQKHLPYNTREMRMTGKYCHKCGKHMTSAEYNFNIEKCFYCLLNGEQYWEWEKIRMCNLKIGQYFKHPLFSTVLIVLTIEEGRFICMDGTHTMHGKYYRHEYHDMYFGIKNQQWVKKLISEKRNKLNLNG